MNFVDVLLILIIFAFFAIGWKMRGIYILFLIVAFFAGIIMSNIAYPFFLHVFFKSSIKESKSIILSYVISFIIFASIVVIIGILISKFFDVMNLTVFDRLLGALFLSAISIIPVYFIFSSFAQMNLFGFKNATKTSLLFPLLENYILFIIKIPIFKTIKIHFMSLFSKKVII